MNVRNGPPGGYPQHPHMRQNQPFPGISDPFAFGGGFPGIGGGTPANPAPANGTTGNKSVGLPAVAKATAPAKVEDAIAEIVEDSAKSKAGGFSLEKLGELKGVVDRLGGIDGILNSMTKMQKIVANVQSMAPLVKVLMGSFKKDAKASKTGGDDDDDDLPVRPRRRKRRKSGAGAKGTTPRRRPRKRTR
ncbi:conserved hypothetical protein [Paenibacillus curdlanolyticus YK9]|uniref:Tyrosine protein kinase n=1 Tax=Paenibacillus curdlanolyticus YK9 TaxID=717606 RepID=E0IAE9_9BACL|nr:hypothetical protein [Paenibacillus curdlanolyticus]EFM10726.1 conserved hypothetical protein [Paenibacillus curdlanolyticus YK9]